MYLNINIPDFIFLSALHARIGGTQTHNPEIKTAAEIKSQMFKQLRQPGTPNALDFLKTYNYSVD